METEKLTDQAQEQVYARSRLPNTVPIDSALLGSNRGEALLA